MIAMRHNSYCTTSQNCILESEKIAWNGTQINVLQLEMEGCTSDDLCDRICENQRNHFNNNFEIALIILLESSNISSLCFESEE